MFLGMRLGCAKCHDHPFDKWKQKDFYGLAAFFGKTQRMDVALRPVRAVPVFEQGYAVVGDDDFFALHVLQRRA